METKERNDEKKTKETRPNTSCWGTDTRSWNMPGCCKGMSDTGNFSSMMGRCMTVCRWFPLVPVIFGIIFLLLGYYLDASITRALWMFTAGFIALLGILGLILAGRMKKMCRGMK
jgi:hypothetical protein